MTDKSDERKAVPREATDAMLAAAMRAEKEYGDDYLPYGSAWRVMFDAAPVLATADERKALEELVAAHDAVEDYIKSRAPVDPERYGKAWANARAVLATAPAEPPKDGEVAALIERLHARTKLMVCKRRDGCWVCDDNKLYLEAADALARLSAPVPEPPDTFVRVAAEALQRVKWRLDPFHGKNIELAREIVADEMAQLPARNDELTFQYRAVQYLTKNPLESAAPVPARELSESWIIDAVYQADKETDGITRVSEMTPEGWKATTIFDGDRGLLAFARLVYRAAP